MVGLGLTDLPKYGTVEVILTLFNWDYRSNKIRKTQNEQMNIILSKFEKSVIVNLMPISWVFGYIPHSFCSRHYWSYLNHHLMANISEKAISILAGNLNLGCSYLITTVQYPINHVLIWNKKFVSNQYRISSWISMCGKNLLEL